MLRITRLQLYWRIWQVENILFFCFWLCNFQKLHACRLFYGNGGENMGSYQSKVSVDGNIVNFDGTYLQNCTWNHGSKFSKINKKDT